MIYKKSYISVILFFLLFIGCAGPTKVNIYKAPEQTYAGYDVIVIPDFRKTDLEWVPYDSGTAIADMVAEDLRKGDKFKVISRSNSLEGMKDQRVLVVDGVVSGYKRGCKYCEYVFQGVDDRGKMSVQVRVTLVDETTGDILADVGVDGRAKPPGTGNSKYIRVVDEIVKVIDAVNNGKS